MTDRLTLTKAETVSLWHAIRWMEECVKADGDLSPAGDPRHAVEVACLKIAKQALRKVNAIRKAQSKQAPPSHGGKE